MYKIYLLLIISFLFPINSNRVITIGGCVTETVFALGMGDNVVAVDISSSIPVEVTNLPQVGYIRGISSEGILSMNPTTILTTNEIGPPKVVEQLRNAGVDLKIFNSPKSYNDIINLVLDIALFLDVEEKGILLKNEIIELNTKIDSIKLNNSDEIKIAFFMSPSISSYTASGSGTRADYLIEYIGGHNIFSDDFNRYKKVSKEDIIKYNPDIILAGYVRASNQKEVLELFTKSEEFKSISAVSNGQVYDVSVGEVLNFGPNFINSTIKLMNRINVDK